MLLKNLPFQLALTILFGITLSLTAPQNVLDVCFTLGMLFKDMLMMFIPLVVAGYLMSALVSFDKKSLTLVIGITALAILSGIVVLMLAFGIAYLTFPFIHLGGLTSSTVSTQAQPLTQLWHIPFTSPLTPTVAIIFALSLGFVAVLADVTPLKNFALQLRDRSTHILKRYFIPLLPLYVLAVILKIQADGALSFLIKDYGKIFCLMHLTLAILCLGALALASRFSWHTLKANCQALFAPLITAFSTMSGVAAMPLLVENIQKRLKGDPYPGFVIPLTTNIHTVGDGFMITFSSLAILYMAFGTLPAFAAFAAYLFYYCLARFFNACVPGGGAIIMAPFVHQYLGLPAEFLGLFMTLYVLQDPLITLWNTLGNGLFALLTQPLFHQKRKDEPPQDNAYPTKSRSA